MKTKFYLFILCSLSLQLTFAQEFSFKMYFFDAIGNSDSITLGFDPNGTDTIDPFFGEINIVNDPITTPLDVRITNEWYNREYFGLPATYHTKTKIIEKNCDAWFTTMGIDIYCENWPVTAVWDSSLFDNPCINGSVFTSQTPNTWWDVSGVSDLARQVLIQASTVTFTPNYTGQVGNGYSYLNDAGDTISHFWQNFTDSTLLSANISELQKEGLLFLFPNPNDGNFQVWLNSEEMYQIKVFDYNGRIVFEDSEVNLNVGYSLDLSSFESAVYVLQVSSVNSVYQAKVIVSQ